MEKQGNGIFTFLLLLPLIINLRTKYHALYELDRTPHSDDESRIKDILYHEYTEYTEYMKTSRHRLDKRLADLESSSDSNLPHSK